MGARENEHTTISIPTPLRRKRAECSVTPAATTSTGLASTTLPSACTRIRESRKRPNLNCALNFSTCSTIRSSPQWVPTSTPAPLGALPRPAHPASFNSRPSSTSDFKSRGSVLRDQINYRRLGFKRNDWVGRELVAELRRSPCDPDLVG